MAWSRPYAPLPRIAVTVAYPFTGTNSGGLLCLRRRKFVVNKDSEHGLPGVPQLGHYTEAMTTPQARSAGKDSEELGAAHQLKLAFVKAESKGRATTDAQLLDPLSLPIRGEDTKEASPLLTQTLQTDRGDTMYLSNSKLGSHLT